MKKLCSLPKYRRVIECYLHLRKTPGKGLSAKSLIKVFKRKGWKVSLRNAQRDLKNLADIRHSEIRCMTANGIKLYRF